MIKPYNKMLLEEALKLYSKQPHAITLTPEMINDLHAAFDQQTVFIAYNQARSSFMLLMPYSKVLAINPWFLGGHPIGEFDRGLFFEVIDYFYTTHLERLELLSHTPFEGPLNYYYDYVDMKLELKGGYEPCQLSIKPVATVSLNTLKAMFHKTFAEGDACFYALLDLEEKVEFWRYLNYDEAVLDDCSVAVYEGEKLIGFSLVIPYGEDNKHITCMCIDTSYQGQGYGRQLMYHIMNTAKAAGMSSITLGTESQMAAYKLYTHLGFKVTDRRHHYYLKK